MSNYTTTSIDNSHFNRWTPWTGVYIAAATFICVIAAVVDLVKGLQTRQYWIPSSWSSLNAASITVMTAASKLLLDISTSMPRQIDQLSKLSTSAFVCVALANVVTSMGKLESGEFPANIAALSIFLISSMVGLCIQLTSGVIFKFRTAHIAMVVITSILLFKCVISAAYSLMYKSYTKARYDTQHEEALKDVKDRKHLTTDKLEQYLERFFMMAHSGCPHSLMAQAEASLIYALCGIVAAAAFFISLIACMIHKNKFLSPTSHSGTSNYSWSVLYILISQTIGVGVGTIVLCIRGYNILRVQSRMEDPKSSREQSTDAQEKYWMQHSEYKQSQYNEWFPLLPYIEYKQQKGLGYSIYCFSMACQFFKKFVVDFDRILFLPVLNYIWVCILKVISIPPHLDESDPVLKELEPYFLVPLDYLHTQTGWMMKSILEVGKICLGAKERETKHLRELLQKYHSYGFEGVFKFRIPPIPPKSQESPPNCWALSVLTLTYIATALPNINRESMDELRKSVMEGLVYVKLIEDNFNDKHDFANFRFNASLLWLKLDVTDMIRFIFDLEWVPNKDCFGDKTAKQTLESIKESARSFFMQARDRPLQSVGAHYLYGTCETILQDCRDNPDDSTLIFDKLCRIISGILGACLINLKSYILLKCEWCSSLEKRREAACGILKLFGEFEEILKILDKRQIPDIPPEKMVRMDNWHQSHHHQYHPEAEASNYYSCNL